VNDLCVYFILYGLIYTTKSIYFPLVMYWAS
jgi:hypothetical protein